MNKRQYKKQYSWSPCYRCMQKKACTDAYTDLAENCSEQKRIKSKKSQAEPE